MKRLTFKETIKKLSELSDRDCTEICECGDLERCVACEAASILNEIGEIARNGLDQILSDNK